MSHILKLLKNLLLFLIICGGIQETFAYTNVSGTLSGNNTWSSGTYYISANLIIPDGSSLTIEPGVIVKVASGKVIYVYGEMNVSGINSDNVTFTSYLDNSVGETVTAGTPSRGNWGGIYVYNGSNNALNMTYGVVKYATYGVYNVSGNNLSITNSLLTENSGYGIYLTGTPSGVINIKNNTISNNTSYGLRNAITTLGVNSGGNSVSSNTFIGNGDYPIYTISLETAVGLNDFSQSTKKAIYVYGDNFVGTSLTIPNNDVDIIYNTQYLTIPEGKTLNIDPGVVLKFTYNSSYMRTIRNYGELNVNGTSSEKVYFTELNDNSVGQENGTGTPSRGRWYGIIMYNGSNNSLNMTYGEVRYGIIGVYDNGGKNFTISNSKMRENSSAGVYVNSDLSTTSSITNSELSDNTNYGLYVTKGEVTVENIDINNNGSIGCYVTNGVLNATSSNFNNNVNYGLYINGTGEGNVSNSVIDSNGSYGIYLNGTPSLVNITNNTISNNTGYGLRNHITTLGINSGGNSVSSNTFIGNGDYPIYTISLETAVGLNDFSQSTKKAIYVYGDNFVGTSLTIPNNDVDIIYNTQYLTIPEGKTLNIDPGVVLKFTYNSSYMRTIRNYGELNVNGTSSEKVYFTELNDNSVGQENGTGTPSRGRWYGIIMYNGSNNSLNMTYGEVRYGIIGVYDNGGKNFTISNSKMRENSSAGVYVNSDLSTTSSITNSELSDNTNYGLYVTKGEVTVENIDINNNGSIGCYVTNGVLNATSSNFNNNVNYGLYIDGTGEGNVSNSVIDSNGLYGIYLNGTPSSINITNNTISNNTNYGLRNAITTLGINSGGNSVSSNTFIGNGDYPIYTISLETAVGLNDFSQSTKKAIYVHGDNFVGTSFTIPNNDVDIIYNSQYLTIPQGKTLNIDSGVVFKFIYSSSKRTIRNYGELNVNGTSSEKVYFTEINDNSVGQENGTGTPVRGRWGGIYVYDGSNNALNMTYGVVKYATYGVYNVSGNNLSITNSLLTENSVYGIYLTGTPSGVININNNTISNNTSYGLRNTITTLGVNSGGNSISSNTFVGNGNYPIYTVSLETALGINDFTQSTKKAIYVYGDNFIGTSLTIPNNDVDIVYNSQFLTIPEGKILNIDPGVVFKFIYSSSYMRRINVYGELNINGTGSEKVYFTELNDNSVGQENGTGAPVRGRWQGIYMYNGSNNSLNMTYGEVRYAVYGVYDNGGKNFTISNSKMRENSSAGVYVNSDLSTASSITNSELSDNTNYGLYVTKGEVTVDNIDINNNGSIGCYVTNGVLNATSSNFNNNVNYGLYINGTGEGNISDSTFDTNGSYGIYLNGTPSGINITNNTISYNTGYGLRNHITTLGINSGGNTVSSNTFVGNGDYPIYTISLEAALGLNDFSQSTKKAIYVYGDNFIGTSLTIPNNDVDIIYNTQYLTIPEGKTLNIDPGVVLKFTYNSSYMRTIRNYGELNVNGTSSEKVYFTELNDNSVGQENGTGTPSRGRWYGIIMYNGSNNSLNMTYGEVRYGIIGVYDNGGKNFTISNSKMIENSSVGLYVNSDLSTTSVITNSELNNNTSYGLYVKNGEVTVNNINANNNDNIGCYITNGTLYATSSNFNNNVNYGLYINGTGEGSIYNCDFNNNNSYGVYYRTGTFDFRNNIVYSNGSYGLYLYDGVVGSKIIEYNLFYGNTNGKIYPTSVSLDSSNIEGQDPLFIDEIDYMIAENSPAVDAGDPSFGLHPVSGTLYDIGSSEDHDYVYKGITASLKNIGERDLTYEWNFLQEPTNGSNPPELFYSSGDIISSNLITGFWIKKLGTYKVKLVIKENGEIVGTGTSTINVVR